MSLVKESLKSAKKALSNCDWDEAIELSNEVLKKDKSNYFARVFLGKAHEALREYKNAKEQYIRAIELDSENPIAWKGLFVTLNTCSVPDIMEFDEYFQLCREYAQLLISKQLPLIDLLDDIRNFRKKYPESEESFLRNMRPGQPLAEVLGHNLISPIEVLEKLLKLHILSEQQKTSKLISRARMKVSINDPDYHYIVNSSAWEIYKDSDVDGIYKQLINLTDDDEKRRILETAWLEYRLKLLKTMPKELKPKFFPVVQEMVDDMIVVKHNSVLAWSMYFEWKDYTDLESLDVDVCLTFIQKFPSEPLAMVIYAWVCSCFSSYDSKLFYNNMIQSSAVDHPEESEEKDLLVSDNILDDEDEYPVGLSEATILEVLQENIKKCQQNILANRIIAHYYVCQKEYRYAIPFIRTGTTCVATSIRDLGATLKNSKFDFTLLYATCYTYFEAPKNHNIALSLFDKVLSEDPKNTKAKMGKGLIFIERKNWVEANKLLADAVEEFPQNYEIVSEYGWCLLHINKIDEAIEKFQFVLENAPSNEPQSSDFRALNYWRIAKALLYRADSQQQKEVVEKAYQTLIHALKVSDLYAPAYSLLGFIYKNFFADEDRAFKCFFKALSLDPGDLHAAYYMAEKYCANGNWESAALICDRIVKTDVTKNALQSTNWPYRVLGISCLERQKNAESIEWFQSAIRIDAEDVESWVGLGQAYLKCGRVEASVKVFEKILTLDKSHKYAHYFLGNALAELGEYEKSLETIGQLISLDPSEECFLVLEVTVLMEYAFELLQEGFLLKSVNVSTKAIAKIEHILCSVNLHVRNIWIALSKAIKVFVVVESQIDSLPIDSLVRIFDSIEITASDELYATDRISLTELLSDELGDNVSIALKFLILSSKYALLLDDSNCTVKTIYSSLWYNLACAELFSYLKLNDENYRTAAITCFKKSITYQSNFVDSWVGLGISTMYVNYQVSQHCFIKAIALNPKETGSWYCLAMLAMTNNDPEIAHQILMKSQSISPQESQSWLGLALILEKEGLANESAKMFAHAYVLSNGRSKMTQLMYAKNVLAQRTGNQDSERNITAQQELSAAAFGLSQYLKKSQDDLYAIQLSVLALERLHDFKTASQLAKRLSTLVEERFEKNQDEKELFNYAEAKSQIARLYLEAGDYSKAIETACFSLSVLEDSEQSLSLSATNACVSNHVVLGLAYFFSNELDLALEHSNILLNSSKNSTNIATLIFRVLYAMESEEASDIALQALLEYVDTNGNNLDVTLLLAAFFVLEDRPEELRELSKQLKSIPLEAIIADRHKDVPFLIQEINKRLLNKKDSLMQWQKSAFFFPNNSNVWDHLSTIISNRISSTFQNRVTSYQLSGKLFKLGDLAKIQRSIFLCPWNKEATKALQGCF